MLKNGTLLKVSPELIQALKNALDLRYLPLIQQARRQRRSLITDDVEAVDTGYNGYFKVVWDNEVDEAGNVTKRRVKVINGADPESGIAGYLYIASAHTVNAQTLELLADSYVYFIVWYNGINYQYAISTKNELPEGASGNFASYMLASINRNGWIISQAWVGGAIYLNERYYI